MATSGVVHLLQPSGGFFCIEIALPPSEDNGIKRYDDLYQWVHEQVLAEKVDSSQAMQDPFLLSTTNHLDPATVIAKTAVVRSHKEVYYFRKSLVQNSVNHQSVENLFYTPAAPSVDTGKEWDAVLYMKRFPHLWSWRRKPSVAGMEPWQPSEVIFNDKPLPHQMRFQGARWLCAPEHMASAVRAEFGTEAGSIEPPENIQMITTFDYLEWAFEDLFGSWVPSSQRFCPAYPHQFPEYRDPMFDRSSLIARLLNRTYASVEEPVLDGTAVFWLPARSADDARFVTLLRHAHVLPFAPLPNTRADADPTAPDTMYAVLQPVDHISCSVLADISLAHADRAAHRQEVAQRAASGAAGHPGQQLQAALAAADKPPPPPQSKAATEGSAGGQPMKRQRTAEEPPAAPQPQEGALPAAQPAAAAAPPRAHQYTAFTKPSPLPLKSLLWHLTQRADRGAELFETGFLVHVVPLVLIMQAQHARFLPQHLAPPVSFHHPWAAAPTPGDPRPPAERRRSIVFGCDIDHTLINQAHAVLPRVMGGWYPEPFPPWPAQSPPPNAILQSDALMRYIMANKKTLHITNFSDNNKSWPESARALRMADKSDSDAMLALIDQVVGHVHRRRAFLVVTPDQTFKPPHADDSKAFTPGCPYIDEPKAKHLHMNVIFPRRDLAELIKACCPLIPSHPGNCFVNYKAVFTTAATQTYADIVIQGLYELSKMWVDFSHDFRKDLQQCQVSAFFNGPVLSMAYGRNLGPDPLLESHPCPVDSGVTKNFAKFLLFGGLPSGSTLHEPSWELTKSAAIILDDSPVAWGPMEKPLLLHLQAAKRFKDVEDRMSITEYVDYLALHGADFHMPPQGGAVRTDGPTPLGGAAERMRIMFDQCVRQIVPRRPPLDLLLPLSLYHWREHSSMQQAHRRALEDEEAKVKALTQTKADLEAKVRALEGELKKARARLKRPV